MLLRDILIFFEILVQMTRIEYSPVTVDSATTNYLSTNDDRFLLYVA